MTRVLFVDHAEALGGAEQSLLLLLRHLDRGRFEPILACNEGALAHAAGQMDVVVEILDMPRLRRELSAPIRLAKGVAQLMALIKHHHVDAVQANVMRASLYAAPAARFTGRPLVWHVRDVFRPGPYVSVMGRLAARTIAVSKAASQPLPHGLMVDIIPNGVDLAALDASLDADRQLREVWRVPQGRLLVGLVGRLRAWKGQQDFVRAMARVAAHCPQAHFVLVGGGIFGGTEAYESQLKMLVADLGLQARLVFAGQREDLGAVLSALDVLVHCSTQPEPFGRIIIEGLAARLPVVAYDYGGPSEILEGGASGLLVAPRDIRALAEAVLWLLRDPDLRRRLGEAGRRRVESAYDVRVLTRRIEAVLAEAANARSDRR
ncbi:MAG: glycosyltransferase [Anaerolineae bacterium]|nr:glycosyltransferase [Anaerolineae bacterium]